MNGMKTNGTFEYYNSAVAAAKIVPGQKWLAYDQNVFSGDVCNIQSGLTSEPLAMDILGCLLDTGTFTMTGSGNYNSVVLYTGEYSSVEYRETIKQLQAALPGMLVNDAKSNGKGGITYELCWSDLYVWNMSTFSSITNLEGCDKCQHEYLGNMQMEHCDNCASTWQEHLHGTYINYLELAKELLQSIAESINEGHDNHIYEYAEDLEYILDQYRCAMANGNIDILDFLDSTREQYILIKANQHRLEMAQLYID